MQVMYGILITLSQKRLAQLEGDPETLEDVVDARHETAIPGLLDIGKAWDALDVLLSDRGKDPLLGDAVLARSGAKLKSAVSFEAARVIGPARVAEVAKKLSTLPASHVRDRYPVLAELDIHGKFGETHDAEEIEAMQILMTRVIALYQEAAKAKHSMLTILSEL